LPLHFIEECNIVLCHDSCTLFRLVYKQNSIFVPEDRCQHLCLMTALSWTSSDAESLCVSNPWIVLWSLDHMSLMDMSFIHSYKMFKKITQDPTEIGPKWFVK
jgi:hypothetical protein